MSFAVGLITATSGGGGMLLGPLLLATGARGARFVASASLIALSVHVSRLAAYGAGGLVSAQTLLSSVLIGAAIMAGNAAGKRVALSDRQTTRLTFLVLAGCVAATVTGLT